MTNVTWRGMLLKHCSRDNIKQDRCCGTVTVRGTHLWFQSAKCCLCLQCRFTSQNCSSGIPDHKRGEWHQGFHFWHNFIKVWERKDNLRSKQKVISNQNRQRTKTQNTPFLISLQAFTFLHLHCDAIAASLHHFLHKLVHGLSASNFHELLLLVHFLHCCQRWPL